MVIRRENKLPNWMKLDNAATIYPSTLTKKYASMFRMTVTLKEDIDKELLNKALSNIIKRFPSFRYRLKQGLFWCYFKYIDVVPEVQDDFKNPMLRINFNKNRGFMFRVRSFGKRIAIEYFHALTDGTGGTIFLLTLTAEYLRMKHKLDIDYNGFVLNPKGKVLKEEYEDSFIRYAKNTGALEHEEPAYHNKGTVEDVHVLHVIMGIIPINKLKEKCKEYNCTVTQFIASLLIESLQEIQEKEIKKNAKKRPIKVSIPINLRHIYKTKTLRNFSSYVNIGIQTKYGHYSLPEIINVVKNKMELMISEKQINAKITGNVKLSNNYFIRLIPMFVKKYILSIAEFLMGDRYCSTTLSNMGVINLPKQIEPYVDEMSFIIGKSRGKPGSCSCISYKNNLYLSFSRKIKEANLERLFFTKLIKMNIPIEIESNNGR